MSSGLCRLSKGGWLSRQPPPWAWLFPASVLCPRCLTGSAEWKLLVSLVPFSGWVCFPRFTPETILLSPFCFRQNLAELLSGIGP